MAVSSDDSTTFIYSTLSSAYYLFSGWDKSGNIIITENTTITGSWSDIILCDEYPTNLIYVD